MIFTAYKKLSPGANDIRPRDKQNPWFRTPEYHSGPCGAFISGVEYHSTHLMKR